MGWGIKVNVNCVCKGRAHKVWGRVGAKMSRAGQGMGGGRRRQTECLLAPAPPPL